jgi:uncharacterized protein
MLYLDTSILVAALTNEDLTERTLAWLRGVVGEPLAVSDWTRVELASAMAQKMRMRQLDENSRVAALSRFARMCEGSLTVFGVAASDFTAAARLTDNVASGLRAGDALHLAICLRNNATLCSNDLGFLKACAAVGAMSMHGAP